MTQTVTAPVTQQALADVTETVHSTTFTTALIIYANVCLSIGICSSGAYIIFASVEFKSVEFNYPMNVISAVHDLSASGCMTH